MHDGKSFWSKFSTAKSNIDTTLENCKYVDLRKQRQIRRPESFRTIAKLFFMLNDRFLWSVTKNENFNVKKQTAPFYRLTFWLNLFNHRFQPVFAKSICVRVSTVLVNFCLYGKRLSRFCFWKNKLLTELVLRTVIGVQTKNTLNILRLFLFVCYFSKSLVRPEINKNLSET